MDSCHGPLSVIVAVVAKDDAIKWYLDTNVEITAADKTNEEATVSREGWRHRNTYGNLNIGIRIPLKALSFRRAVPVSYWAERDRYGPKPIMKNTLYENYHRIYGCVMVTRVVNDFLRLRRCNASM
ncbi:hypothetical protein Tco_1446965 [Tanacetum coccineum]